MATGGQLKEAAGMTVFFFVIVSILVAIGRYSEVGAAVGPTVVAVGLIPILFYLIATGQLRRLGGAGFEIALQEQAGRTITLPTDQRIDPGRRETVVGKGSRERLAELRDMAVDERPTTLAFEIGTPGYYDPGIVQEYLEVVARNPEFRYVLFTDGDGGFEGYVDGGAFEALVSRDEASASGVIGKIESGAILDWTQVNTESIPIDTSNREALRVLDRTNSDELAVLDDQEGFVGVVTQDEITRKILANVVREA